MIKNEKWRQKTKIEKKGKNGHFSREKWQNNNNSNVTEKAYKTLIKRQFCKNNDIFQHFVKILKKRGL